VCTNRFNVMQFREFEIFRFEFFNLILADQTQGSLLGGLFSSCTNSTTDDDTEKFKYSVRRLIGSRIIESNAYCNRILLIPCKSK